MHDDKLAALSPQIVNSNSISIIRIIRLPNERDEFTGMSHSRIIPNADDLIFGGSEENGGAVGVVVGVFVRRIVRIDVDYCWGRHCGEVVTS